ncbi:MAG: tetratricopeptide repeat protein [Chitinophagaceae bacterium]
MKKYILMFMFFAGTQHLTAQTEIDYIDSLKQELATEKEDTARCLLLIELSWAYPNQQIDSAVFLVQQSLTLAKKIKYTYGENIALNRLANILTRIGNYPKALEYHLDALKKAESIQNDERISVSFSNLGILYSEMGDYRHGLNYTFKAKSITEGLRDKRRHCTSLLNIGDMYEKMNRLDSARLYTQQAYDLGVEVKLPGIIGLSLNNLGNIYSKMEQNVIAMEFYRSGMPYIIERGIDDAICETTLGMAKLFQKMNRPDSSLYYARLALSTAKNSKLTNRYLNASKFLTNYHKAIGNVDSAFLYQSVMIAANDSLFNQEKTKQIQSLSFAETLRQQEIANEKMLAKQEQQNNLQYIAIAIGIIVFISVFLLLSRTIIVNEKWVEFLGIIGLLIVFEFINLLIHPYLSAITQHSPIWMLLVLVSLAALLIPVHHKVERWLIKKMVVKNKKLRLATAKRIVKTLENDSDV